MLFNLSEVDLNTVKIKSDKLILISCIKKENRFVLRALTSNYLSIFAKMDLNRYLTSNSKTKIAKAIIIFFIAMIKRKKSE
jgi:nucleoside recognition membrane protein YjiH